MQMYVFAPVIAIINETIVKLQARDLVICQQCELLVFLTKDIRDMFKVRHIEDEEDGAFDNLLIANYVRRDDSFVLLTTLREYVDDLGTRMQAHWLLIDTNERMIVLRMVACFVIDISDGIAKVEAQPIMRPSTWRRLSCRWTSSRCDPRRSSPR
jgi:hypothetical protein